MKIFKEAETEISGEITESDLELINKYAKKALVKDDIYTFSVLLCDNEIDRDLECFSTQSLETLSELFVGKTGIFDHNWSSSGQVARIYKTEVLTDAAQLTSYGERYTYLKGWAYMLKSSGNEELIAEINGGIKKEVSVGCSVKKRICSICGGEISGESCPHMPGCEYDGKMCYAVLSEPTDAYEWSFVAVPAQKKAGIMKKATTGEFKSVQDVFSADPALKKQYDILFSYSELGKKYLDALYKETVKLGLMSEGGFDEDFLKEMLKGRSEKELLGFKKAFERKVDEKYPLYFQLHKGEEKREKFSGEEFLI